MSAEAGHGSTVHAPSGPHSPPRRRHVAAAFEAFELVTAGRIEGVEAPLIDHVATGEGRVARRIHQRRPGDRLGLPEISPPRIGLEPQMQWGELQ